MEPEAPRIPENEDEAEPMLPEQFETAMEQTQIRSPEMIAACRAVLVEKKKASEVARSMGIDTSHVGRAVNTVREKWAEICLEQGWEYLPIALPRSSMKLVLEMQHEHLKQYRSQEGKGSGTRRKKK